MDSGLLSLKWNNHSSTFFHVLETIRKKELYSDVTIACDGKFFSVHKLVLSTCSEYFQEMFERTQCKHPIVVLKDINHKDLESLLNYMYIGEVNVIQTELSSLIKAAECLKVKGLAVPDEPPSQNKRPSKRQNDRDDGSVSKKNKRSSSSSIQSPVQNSMSDERKEETIGSTPILNVDSEHLDNSNIDQNLPNEESSNHNFKEYESMVVKTEREDSNPSSYIDDELPPVSKFEYDSSPVSTSMPSEIEERKGSSYSSHLQQQPSSDDSLSHLIPSTSRFSGDSCNWGPEMERLEGGDKERGGGEGYDPSSYILDNSQAKAHMASFNFGGPSKDAQHRGSSVTQRFMEKDGLTWKCVYPFCGYHSHSRVNLLNHVRKHTGEKPFSCNKCDYRSNQCSNLYTHLKRKHKESNG